MKKLLILFSILIMSCASLPNDSSVTVRYDISTMPYNYNNIHHFYSQYPTYFYQNTYLDAYGVQRYMHMHPYFKRYKRDCNTRQHNSNVNIKKRVNYNTTIRRAPTRAPSQSIRVRPTTTRRSTSTTTRSSNTIRRAPTRAPSQNRSTTTRRRN